MLATKYDNSYKNNSMPQMDNSNKSFINHMNEKMTKSKHFL